MKIIKKKESRENNKEKKKAYYKDNKEKIKEQRKVYYEDNKEQIKIYREDNKEKINKRIRKRKVIDPQFKLRNLVSTAINQHLKKYNSSKNGKSSSKYINIQELYNYIEFKFESWMNWQNHGSYNPSTWDDDDPSTWTWQIDHIIPHSHFHYTSMDDDDFKKCWAFENLRPYSSKQNILDGNRR